MRARSRVTTAVASLLAAITALVAVGAAVACRQLVGIGDAPPTDVVDAGTRARPR